jgi:Lrp/AsnC family leucine-responsive transcriptional regulator
VEYFILENPIFGRIKKLEKKQYMKNYIALQDAIKIGKSISVYCKVSLAVNSQELIDDLNSKFFYCSK